jgi:hypothetical protein
MTVFPYSEVADSDGHFQRELRGVRAIKEGPGGGLNAIAVRGEDLRVSEGRDGARDGWAEGRLSGGVREERDGLEVLDGVRWGSSEREASGPSESGGSRRCEDVPEVWGSLGIAEYVGNGEDGYTSPLINEADIRSDRFGVRTPRREGEVEDGALRERARECKGLDVNEGLGAVLYISEGGRISS